MQAAGVTFDSVNQVVIMAGAEQREGQPTRNRTWAFDAAARKWTRLAPAASPPPAATVCGAMVYDTHHHQIILMHPWKPRGAAARQYNTCQVWALASRK